MPTDLEADVSRVSTYLNFMGCAEEAFDFYARIFGTHMEAPIVRMGDMPAPPGAPALPESERALVMYAELPILAGHVLMGTDIRESMGHALRVGNNVTINLEPDSLEETVRLYEALSDSGSESTGIMQMPWGTWACTLDPYGIRWMFNHPDAPGPNG